MGAPYLSIISPFARLHMLIILAITATLFSPATADTASDDGDKWRPSSWKYNATYSSSKNYDARGMGPLYNLTNAILDLFAGSEPIPEGYLIVTERDVKLGPNVANNAWGDLLKSYWGVLLVITLTALLVVLMPIIGLCFCCCRCAGACGGRSQPFDKKHDTCRRAFLGFMLICTTTGILFGVVIAFVTNSYMQEGLVESTEVVRKGSTDTKIFLETTSMEINHLLVINYEELTESVVKLVRDTSNSVVKDLEGHFKADSFKYLSDFADKLPAIRKNLVRMKDIINELRVNASQLSDALRGVKRELLVTLTKCEAQPCREVLEKYTIGKLDANGIDYNQVPDMTDIIDDVGGMLNGDVVQAVSQGKKEIDNMGKKLNETIDVSIRSVSTAMTKAGSASQSASNDIKNAFTNIANMITNQTVRGANTADQYIDDYSIYRFYIGVAISCILLMVLVSLVISLFCGICGKRPEGYGDDCCNKGAGARFLMLAITIMFLSISVLAVATLIHFLVGLILHRGVCVPLRDPQNDQIFNYIDNFIDLNNVLYQNNKKTLTKGPRPKEIVGDMPPFRISQIIVDCKNNLSIYEVLRLANYIDISEVLQYPKDYRINETLTDLVQDILKNSDIQLFSGAVEEKIEELKKSQLTNFQSYRIVDHVIGNITNYSLKSLAEQLRKTAQSIVGKNMDGIRGVLNIQAMHLTTYEDKLVTPMQNQTEELIKLAEELQNDLQYQGRSFEESMEKLLTEIKDAQKFIDNSRKDFVERAAVEIITPFTDTVEGYLHFVVKAVQRDVGKCEPLANVYDSIIVGGCNRIVDPFNGFWAGVGWCVLLFLPTLIISIKLSSLYQKSDPYPGPLVESEYLYDAYSERDNIPLANGPKNKRRKAKDRRRGSRDRRGDYYEDSGSSHGASAARDTRYSDMAPRHWDGGPPRYQNPPMAPPASEYERPPPYYYPGAPSEQE